MKRFILIALLLSGTACRRGPDEVTRVAFGSCASQRRTQPFWDAILAVRPQVFLFLGDNVYADTLKPVEIRRAYKRLGSFDGYKRLKSQVLVLATWDDHDFAYNDAGAENPIRNESQEAFLDFFDVSRASPRRWQKGIYHAEIFGKPGRRVQFILLDTRYFRTPLARDVNGYIFNRDPEATILGAAQWAWLEEQLRQPAELRVLCSSIQVLSQQHGSEKWDNIPHERERLLKTIRESGARGVVILSGDRHHGEISLSETAIGYPLFDITSSSLNRPGAAPLREPNRWRVGDIISEENFGLILIDWEKPDPVVRFELRRSDGTTAAYESVVLSALKANAAEVSAGTDEKPGS